ncbi:transposase [Micromonospora sp. NPDC023814]|uniref:transposase n=1 Tax=Micromonospora sp. NPDC023814 TaxID=3154596 RepID=UPI0033C68ECF
MSSPVGRRTLLRPPQRPASEIRRQCRVREPRVSSAVLTHANGFGFWFHFWSCLCGRFGLCWVAARRAGRTPVPRWRGWCLRSVIGVRGSVAAVATEVISAEGRQLYARRGALVEPGFAQLFQRFGRRMHQRGTAAVDTEIKLLGAVHNLNKIFRHDARQKTSRQSKIESCATASDNRCPRTETLPARARPTTPTTQPPPGSPPRRPHRHRRHQHKPKGGMKTKTSNNPRPRRTA